MNTATTFDTHIQGSSGHFFCAEEGGGFVLTCNRESAGPLETFTVHHVDRDRIAIQAQNGMFVRALEDGTLLVDAEEIGICETFAVVALGRGIALKSHHGRFVCAEQGGGTDDFVAANRDVVGPWETLAVSTWGVVDAGMAPIAVHGTRFSADIREVGGFTLHDQILLHGHEEMRYFPEQVVRIGGNQVRIMLALGGSEWWRARARNGKPVVVPQLTDAYYARLPETCAWLSSFGLSARICFIGALDFGGPIPDRKDHYTKKVAAWAEAHVERVARALIGVPNVMGEIANEYNQIGFGSNAEAVIHLGEIVKRVHPNLVLCGSNENGPNGDETTFVCEPFDYVDNHLDRRRGYGGFEWVKRSSESPVVDNDEMPFMSGEPIKLGSAAPGRRDGDDNERSPAVALCYAATSRMKGYATNFHFDGALNCDPFDAQTIECALAWKDGLSLIPLNLDAAWKNGHWAESPFDASAFPSKDDNEETWPHIIRIFGRSDGYWVSVGHRADYNPPIKPGRTVRELGARRFGAYVCRIWQER